MDEIENETNPPNRLAGPQGYQDKTILVTGGTGFLGKVLVEKLLRTCPKLNRIYLIIRDKKGKDPQDRIKEMFNSPLYDLLKKTRGEEILKKVVAVPGDLCDADLGLSKENRKLLAGEVEIIFHLAATVRFDEPLKKTVLLNTRATKLLLALAKDCANLLVFCHVSTAYCHLNQRVLYEKGYPPPIDPHNVIRAVEGMDESTINTITDKLLGDCPNTYSFTKALGEALVDEQMDKLPVIILRPSIVVPIWKDPLPGWTDNINGPMGILIGAGKGIIRTMYCDSQTYADFLPVDVVVNSLLLSSYNYMNNKERRYYNITSSFEYKISWNELIDLGKKIMSERMPLNGVVWYPGGSMKSSRLHQNICLVLFHYIPAMILDGFIFISGNKPVLWRIQQRISKGLEVLEYYVCNQWDFNNDGSLAVRKLFNETEKKIYNCDGEGFDLEEYFYNATHGARLYILKEKDETIPAARRHITVMWAVDKIVKILFMLWIGHLLLKYFVFPMLDF